MEQNFYAESLTILILRRLKAFLSFWWVFFSRTRTLSDLVFSLLRKDETEPSNPLENPRLQLYLNAKPLEDQS